ncbi:MAG: glycosyltransferase [Verrucomicrobia bacterium]|nr:glycosyltransferase [Verrucomicrobiota bacterium]
MNSPTSRIAYVVKRYPRFSETFIVNEILAHEAAGRAVEIISLYPPNDTHFQDVLARVRAPVTYVNADGLKAVELWNELERAADAHPGLWTELASARGAEAREVYQAARLARLVRERGIGLLHAHFASTATEVARLAARFAGVPFTFTAHAKDIFHESADADDLRRKLAGAARVITVSDYNVTFLRRQFGHLAARVCRLYNGIDLNRFPFTSPRERPSRIVAVGRLIEKKGFAVLVSACDLLARRGVAFECEIIGTGELEPSLRAQIESLGLKGRVRLAGPRPQQEIISLVGGAAVLAAPCVVGADGNADGLPTVLLEAMALGTPCVSTDVTGIPEVIRDGETGLRVKQHDSAGLADALERLLADAALRAALATRARALMEREFDARHNAAQLWDWFADAIREGHAHGAPTRNGTTVAADLARDSARPSKPAVARTRAVAAVSTSAP